MLFRVLAAAGIAVAIATPRSARAQNIFDFLIPKTICFIWGTGSSPAAPYVGPDGHTVPLTRQQCQEANAEAQRQELQDTQKAEQQQEEQAQRAAQEAQKKQQEHFDAAKVAALLDEERGYKHITMTDLLLDRKDYATNGGGVAVVGFYKLQGRRDERLYISYDDFMMHTFQSVEAQYIGLITDNASRSLREYLMRCGEAAGCNVTILGHIRQCSETNAFGATAEDLCLVADDMGAQAN